MDKAKEIALKHELWSYIKQVGVLWREDIIFLDEYAKDVYLIYKDNLPLAISCFQTLLKQKLPSLNAPKLEK